MKQLTKNNESKKLNKNNNLTNKGGNTMKTSDNSVTYCKYGYFLTKEEINKIKELEQKAKKALNGSYYSEICESAYFKPDSLKINSYSYFNSRKDIFMRVAEEWFCDKKPIEINDVHLEGSKNVDLNDDEATCTWFYGDDLHVEIKQKHIVTSYASEVADKWLDFNARISSAPEKSYKYCIFSRFWFNSLKDLENFVNEVIDRIY
jgi:hypothetical protein